MNNPTCKLAHPPCQFEFWSKLHPGCDEFGKLPDGSSCDCDKTSILGFEWYGCSHRVAVLVNASLSLGEWYEFGTPDEFQPPLRALHAIMEQVPAPEDVTLAVQLTQWCKDFAYFAGYAAGNTAHYLYL